MMAKTVNAAYYHVFLLYPITHERNRSTDICMCVSGDIQIKDMWPNILWTYLSGIEL